MHKLVKLFTYLFWLVCISNYFFLFWFVLNYIFIGLLLIHLVEFIVFHNRIVKSGNNLFMSFINVMLFGIFYINTLKHE